MDDDFDDDTYFNEGNTSSSSTPLADDDFALHGHHRRHHHHHQYTNYTLKTSVTIRVTPYHNYYVSWGILWGCFLLSSLLALYQVIRERKVLARRRHAVDDVMENPSQGEQVSTADVTRSQFRRLLFIAMVARLVVTPLQIWSDPMFFQFFSDTLPEMIFASAWSLLVMFFIQMVGIAQGTFPGIVPGIVIQATAYAVYFMLILVLFFNNVASVLVYALLCCVYAALFGIALYFLPRLVGLMRPSLVSFKALEIRLFACTFLCMLVFWAQVIRFARLVVAPPRKVYWWWNYGLLELLPSTVLLIVMHPRENKMSRHDNDSVGNRGPDEASQPSRNRIPSPNPQPSSNRPQETTGLLKNATIYGSSGDVNPV